MIVVGCAKQTDQAVTIVEEAPLLERGKARKEFYWLDQHNVTVRNEWTQRAHEVSGQVYAEPTEFSEYVSGVKTKLDTKDKVIALTLDACGGETGSGFDEELIHFLITHNIKADLFINARWIDANRDIFLELAANPLFTIQNHGTEHKPLAVSRRSAWGIESTTSKEEIVEEIMGNQLKIFELTGKFPQYYRSGTAFYDDVAVKIAEDLHLEVVNFDVIGDAGATFSKEQVVDSMKSATAGSVIILHMNHPESETADGVKEAVLELINLGFQFVHLHEYRLK